MSTAAYVSEAVQARYATFAFSGKPALWPERAPLKDGTGAAVNPPFVEVYTDDAGASEFATGASEFATGMAVETVRVRFEVYALTKASLRALVRGVQYDDGAPGAREGMDDADSLTFTASGMSLNAMWRTGPGAVTEEPGRSLTADIVYKCVLNYACEVITTAA